MARLILRSRWPIEVDRDAKMSQWRDKAETGRKDGSAGEQGALKALRTNVLVQ